MNIPEAFRNFVEWLKGLDPSQLSMIIIGTMMLLFLGLWVVGLRSFAKLRRVQLEEKKQHLDHMLAMTQEHNKFILESRKLLAEIKTKSLEEVIDAHLAARQSRPTAAEYRSDLPHQPAVNKSAAAWTERTIG